MEEYGSASDWSSRPRCLRSDISQDIPDPGSTPRSDEYDSPPDLQRKEEGNETGRTKRRGAEDTEERERGKEVKKSQVREDDGGEKTEEEGHSS